MPDKLLTTVGDADWSLLRHTYGVILIAGQIALFLSGALFLQVVLYFRLYPSDSTAKKSLVIVIFLLDLSHSAMICAANWQNLVDRYGVFAGFSTITWSIATTVALTAMTTFIAHSFFSYRIFSLSGGNFIITSVLGTLALARLVSGLVTTGEMVRLKDFEKMLANFEYLLTLGLAIATALDVMITALLCFYLHRRRSQFSRMNRVVNGLTLFAVETGMLTCITTVLSLACWLRMPENLIFMGLHLNICKLYANSIMASLNTRKSFMKRMQGTVDSQGYHMPVMFPSTFSTRTAHAPWTGSSESPSEPYKRPPPVVTKPLHVNIDIETTVHPGDYSLPQASVQAQSVEQTHADALFEDRKLG